MDIDLGNLVYIIFVVIIIVVNLFTKAKKNAQRPKPTNNEAPTEGRIDPRKSFEELLEEFTQPKAQAPVVIEEEQEVPRPQPVQKKNIYADYKPKAKPQKEHSIMKTEYGKFEEFEEEVIEDSTLAKDFADLDAAKKAFIYSEIFNRKY